MSKENLGNISPAVVGGTDAVRQQARDAVRELLEIGGEAPRTHDDLARVSGLAVEVLVAACPDVGDVVGAAKRLGKRLMLPGERRAAILQAGLEFARANGYSAVTCEAVGEAAGCSYNTVRRHFANRGVLVAEIAKLARKKGLGALYRQGMAALG